MPRRNRRPKPRRRPQQPNLEPSTKLSPELLARQLVARGLASPLILGKEPRPTGEGPSDLDSDSTKTAAVLAVSPRAGLGILSGQDRGADQ